MAGISAICILVVGIIGYLGVGGAEDGLNTVGEILAQRAELQQRIIDHYVWIRKLGEFQRNENLDRVDVEKDEHSCAFGKWPYGEGRAHMEAVYPEVKGLLSNGSRSRIACGQNCSFMPRMARNGSP